MQAPLWRVRLPALLPSSAATSGSRSARDRAAPVRDDGHDGRSRRFGSVLLEVAELARPEVALELLGQLLSANRTPPRGHRGDDGTQMEIVRVPRKVQFVRTSVAASAAACPSIAIGGQSARRMRFTDGRPARRRAACASRSGKAGSRCRALFEVARLAPPCASSAPSSFPSQSRRVSRRSPLARARPAIRAAPTAPRERARTTSSARTASARARGRARRAAIPRSAARRA